MAGWDSSPDLDTPWLLVSPHSTLPARPGAAGLDMCYGELWRLDHPGSQRVDGAGDPKGQPPSLVCIRDSAKPGCRGVLVLGGA